MPDPTLPPQVYQGLGWSPAADPTQAPPVPAPPAGSPSWGGLPPAIPQHLGWAPPPDAPPMAPDLPPTPTSLPSSAGQQPASGPSGAPDFTVPVSAFGKIPGGQPVKPGTGPVPPGGQPPAPPRGFNAQMQQLQQREAGTEQAQQQAIQAGVDATKQLHADQLAAYQQAQKTTDANAAARQAEDESWKKTYATNAAKTAADQQAVDSWKFNRNKFMDDLGIGGRVRWGIGQILAGIGQGMMRQGGNPVTEMLQQNIHDANEAQMKERDALVQKLGFDRETGKDAAQYHATRQAEIDKQDGLAYTALGKQLEEAAVKSADPLAKANGLKEAANVRAMGDERLKSYVQLQSEHEHQQGQLAIAGGELALNRQKFTWEKDKEQQQLDINAAKLLATKQGKLDDEQAKRALYIPGPDGQLVVARKQDGTPVLAGSAEIASKDQNMVAAAGSYNRLVGQMIRGIKDHGGESDYLKSKDWQNMQSDLESAVAELHDAYGITSFREPTMKFFEKMASGGVDPTSFIYDATAALQRSNQNLQAKVNERIGARGYDGPKFGWQDTSQPAKPEQTADDMVAGRALINPVSLYDKDPHRVVGELGIDTKGLRTPELTQKVAARLREEGGILPSVRQAMGTYGAALSSPDPKVAGHYRTLLQKIADDSESPAASAYAQQLLDRAQQQQVSATPGAANAPEPIRGASGAPRSP